VTFSGPVGGMITITIELNPGWRFDPVCNNVSVQDYAAPPTGNAAPGQFAYQDCASGSWFSIDVPLNKYYAVHANVERQGGY